MSNQHQATPDEWAQQEDWANRSVFSNSSCILELRARVEALEVGQQPRTFTAEEVAPIVVPSPASSLVERNPECVANWPGCYEGGYDPHCCRFPKSCSCEVRQEVRPASSLVERIKRRLIKGVGGTWEEASCDVIREVATWLKEKGYSTLQAEALEQETNQ
jgi:hypothetical protein